MHFWYSSFGRTRVFQPRRQQENYSVMWLLVHPTYTIIIFWTVLNLILLVIMTSPQPKHVWCIETVGVIKNGTHYVFSCQESMFPTGYNYIIAFRKRKKINICRWNENSSFWQHFWWKWPFNEKFHFTVRSRKNAISVFLWKLSFRGIGKWWRDSITRLDNQNGKVKQIEHLVRHTLHYIFK